VALRGTSRVKSQATLPLLVEIGCEEIPARFLHEAQKSFGERLRQALEGARLVPENEEDHGSGHRAIGAMSPSTNHPVTQSFSTPRRLTVYVPRILKRQLDQVEEVLGPPVRVAFDGEGKPTRAAQSFAAKNHVRVEDLVRVAGSKGEYLAARRTTQGRPAAEVLEESLPAVITALTFPKSMYWTAKSGPRFVRPIRWVLALLGEGKRAEVVPVEIAGVKSGRSTYGHRTLGDKPVRVQDFKDYLNKVPARRVEFDPEKRRATVRAEIKVLLEGSGQRVVEDSSLEDWIVNSTEWPRALLGSFEDRFLKLPREILITVMRDHQKYFAVEDATGNLQPKFVTILNCDPDPDGVIRHGHERVLTARFSDAEFFWKADQKVPLRDRLPMLEKVTYQEKLGSYADKVRRMEAIHAVVCGIIQRGESASLSASEAGHALRAIELCKCDLTTHMVQEFPELQGVVGGLYAREQREPEGVWQAVYDHYRPQGAEDACPRSLVGAIVSLTDKLHGVVSAFAAGLEVTSSSDPFGLRRQRNGIIKLLTAFRLRMDLAEAVKLAVELMDGGLKSTVRGPAVKASLRQFFRDGVQHYMESVERLPYDTVRAVIEARKGGAPALAGEPAVHSIDPLDLLERAKQFQSERGSDDFQALCAAAKRIRNILTQSAEGSQPWLRNFNKDKLEPGPETELYDQYEKVDKQVKELQTSGDYRSSLRAIATLRPAVDKFFDGVLVMAEDPVLRQHRLGLLGKLDALFTSVADLSQIESKTLGSVDAPTS
jgi:glycyl-tRNA synthetase beta chain